MNLPGVSFFLSRGLYGARPRTHVDLYSTAPGYFFIEAGSLTLEIETTPLLSTMRSCAPSTR